MLGRKKGGSSSKPHEPIGFGTTVTTDRSGGGGGGQQAAASQFILQLDEAAAKRLHRMSQRLRLLEQQMEALETEVWKASSGSYQ